MLGVLKQRQTECDPIVKENMIEYAIELLQDAVDFSWLSAKGAHFVLVQCIADGMADWADLDSVNKIREKFSKSTGNNTQNANAETNKNLKTTPCFKFNGKGFEIIGDWRVI